MLTMSGSTITFELFRHEIIQEGRTFSQQAIEELGVMMTTWVITRVKRRWDETNEPPSALKVTITAETQ